MSFSIWKCRPSPFRTRVLGLLLLILVIRLGYLRVEHSSRKFYSRGPQGENREFFVQSERNNVETVVEVQDEKNFTELPQIRKRLFSSDTHYSFNKEKFTKSNGVVIAVQVHSRPQFFKILIESLRVSADIQKIDLVISHDIWDPKMDEITRSIDFCRVHQIYFPLSANFFHGEFPADGKNDCVWNMAREKQENCVGDTDLYGHFREAKIVNIKHHWWWKLNRIYRLFADFKQLVLLEEDHAVTPDFLHILHSLTEFSISANANINQGRDRFMMTFGTYKYKITENAADWQTIISASFDSGKHNMGMILSKALVNEILSPEVAQVFCSYDDYNWDFSLFHTVMTSLKVLRVFYPQVPRIFHLGDKCGVHHKKGDCVVKDESFFRELVHQNRRFLFPGSSFLPLKRSQEFRRKKLKPNGGWGDRRDRELCKLLSKTVLPSELLYARHQFLDIQNSTNQVF